MAMMSYFQLYFTCETGESIDVNIYLEYFNIFKIYAQSTLIKYLNVFQKNELDDILYCGHWYNLPTNVQKVILFLKRRRGVKITEGPFQIINREYFLRVR